MTEDEDFDIWITIRNDNPDMEDFARIKGELEGGDFYSKKNIGIGLTKNQWGNFRHCLSRFEDRLISDFAGFPIEVMGLNVRIIQKA